MGKVTPEQMRKALQITTEPGGAAAHVVESEMAAELLMPVLGDRLPVANIGHYAMGIHAGMELVRRYGVLALDDANLPGLVPAEHGPAAQVVLAEVAHRNGYHVAWLARADFENYLQLPQRDMALTDQQWMELDDKLDESIDLGASLVGYLDRTVRRAGWRQAAVGCETCRKAGVDDNIDCPDCFGAGEDFVSWVHRPASWDEPEHPATAHQRIEQQIGRERLAADLADAADEDGMP